MFFTSDPVQVLIITLILLGISPTSLLRGRVDAQNDFYEELELQDYDDDDDNDVSFKNFSCSTFDQDLDEYLYNYYYYDGFYSHESIYSLTENRIVQFFMYKILEGSSKAENGIKSLEGAFADPAAQQILITYTTALPCGGKNKKNVETYYTFAKERAVPGIFKVRNNQQRKVTITIDVTITDGFDDNCSKESICQANDVGTYLKLVICRVSELLFLHWRIHHQRSSTSSDHRIDISYMNADSCYYGQSQITTIEYIQFLLFMYTVGLFNLIVFILLVRYRFTIHDYISKQTQGNKVRSLLFWSFIISVNLLCVYIAVIGAAWYSSSEVTKRSVAVQTVQEYSTFDIVVLAILSGYFIFYVFLHIIVSFCCMCSCNKQRSSTSLCIPGTCFSMHPECSYPFQSFAFCVLNIIPHLVLCILSFVVLQFTSSPIPSVTVVFYFILLLFANVIVNAAIVNLTTSVCKTNEKAADKPRQGAISKCCYLLFGCMVAIACNSMTIMVVIALIDYLLNTTEQSSYSTILPGVIITVCGWYFSGDITKYTGIDLSLDDGNSRHKATTTNDDINEAEKGNFMEDLQIKNDHAV